MRQTLEKTRILRDLSKKFDGIDAATTLASSEKESYELYLKVKEEVAAELESYSSYLGQMDMIAMMMDQVPYNGWDCNGQNGLHIERFAKMESNR